MCLTGKALSRNMMGEEMAQDQRAQADPPPGENHEPGGPAIEGATARNHWPGTLRRPPLYLGPGLGDLPKGGGRGLPRRGGRIRARLLLSDAVAMYAQKQTHIGSDGE